MTFVTMRHVGIIQINKTMDKDKTYREINGSTRVGDFLRSINKSNLIGKVIGVGSELATGDVLGALQTLISDGDTGMTPEERSHAIELVKLDIEKSKGISKRWNSDLKYGNSLTRNVRPLTLIFLTVSVVVGWYLDYNIDAMTNLLTIVLTAYFGSRTFEKVTTTKSGS